MRTTTLTRRWTPSRVPARTTTSSQVFAPPPALGCWYSSLSQRFNLQRVKMRWFLLFFEWFVDYARCTYWNLFGRRSGLCSGSISSPGPLDPDKKKKNGVLRKEFDEFEVPKNLDVIVICSGVGGLTVAATLAKLGKKVLVLEQDEQAGGLCKTFSVKGFEFDSGFHYVGQLHENGFLKVALDLITDGQVHFAEQDAHVDTVVIGKGKQRKEYTIYSGKRQMEAYLTKQFPNDTKAVEELFKIMKIASKKIHLLCMLKMLPLWFTRFLLWSGIADLISPLFRYSRTSTTDVLKSLTVNRDLLTVFSQTFYGVPPKNSSCMIDALLLHHSKLEVYYPKGGTSEITYRIIQFVEKHGGKVLMKAPVSSILLDEKENAYGVTVKIDGEIEIKAPVIVSNAGMFNTFRKLLPPEVQAHPGIQDYVHTLKPGKAYFQVFAGFNGTEEDLGVSSTNMRLFKTNNMDEVLEEYFDLDKEDAPDNIPMMYMSFPSARDPTSHTLFLGQSHMVIQTMVNPKWFRKWNNMNEMDRGDEYEKYKMRFANHLFDWACVHFPKLREKLLMMHAVSPINMHGLGATNGSMLSAEHSLERYRPLNIAKIRCNTPIKNLYLSGQDIFSAGFSGALHGGLLCASSFLDHCLYIDLLLQQKKLKNREAKKLQ
ncbi:inactive all-trans-retinol 13,14-reductase-like [Triplophysa dalaica]|uniref:inactive all-trans-retinol 13,14-reductase-like n=1 Tax=Triplophysa dalaica TaxID=1582913 RepID=UPI0024DF81D9|nr:inactive all-trans-retinol 13,14-reductase-like [Triplophysa dalaica]